jgi:hypothetical protein
MNNMTTQVGHEKITREKGYLYYIGKGGHVERVSQGHAHGKSKRHEVVSKESYQRKPGKLIYLGSNGYVQETNMSRGKRHKAR